MSPREDDVWTLIASLRAGLSSADKGRITDMAILIGTSEHGGIPDDDHAIGKLLGIRPCLVAKLYRPLFEGRLARDGGTLRLRSESNETSQTKRNVANETLNIVSFETKRRDLNASRARIESCPNPSSSPRPKATHVAESQVPRTKAPYSPQMPRKRAPKRAPNGAPCPGKPGREVDVKFNAFWELYPRRVGKGAAVKAFRKACDGTAADLIIAAVKAIAPFWAERELQYVPHPATWLGQRRWLDDLPTKAAANGGARKLEPWMY